MRPHVPQALITFLDNFYHEIVAVESEHGLTISANDLRPPIDYFHDAVRALQAHANRMHERLSVARVADDLKRLRTRAEWLESGPFVFLKPSHAAQAVGFKRRAIAHAGDMKVPPEAMLIDIADFLSRYRPMPALQEELKRRQAELLTTRQGNPAYAPYPAGDFWKEAQAAIQRYQEATQAALPHLPSGLVEDARPRKSLLGIPKAIPKLTRTDPKQARQHLTQVWLQTLHPLNIWQAASRHEGSASFATDFHPDRVVSEAQWQSLTGVALRLAKLYEQYIVLFTAAMQDTVNRNFKELLEDMNQFVTDASELMEVIKEILEQASEVELAELQQVIEQTPNDELKESLMVLLHQQMMERNRRDAKKEAAQAVLKETDRLIKEKDQQIQHLDKAHFEFLASQLMVYHNSQDLIKKMSGQGLNIAGKFMETETARGTGRGQGPRRGR